MITNKNPNVSTLGAVKGLTPEQKAQYERDGYTILKSVFSKTECEEFVEHMMALHSGQKDTGRFRSPQTGRLGSY